MFSSRAAFERAVATAHYPAAPLRHRRSASVACLSTPPRVSRLATPTQPTTLDSSEPAPCAVAQYPERRQFVDDGASSSSAWHENSSPAPPPPAQPSTRRTTAAPQTVHAGASGPADPRLVHLTRQLLAARTRGDMAAALAAQELSVADFRRLLTYLDRQGAPGVALAAFRCRRRLQFDPGEDSVLWTKLMKMHSARPGGAPAALSIYGEMRQAGVAPDRVAYNVAIAAAGKGRLWRPLLAVREDMRQSGTKPDAYTYSSLLGACQGSGRWEQALEWFEEIAEEAGVQPNVVHYTALMTTLQRAGQWERSMQVFRRLEASGTPADAVAYNSAIAACAKGLEWEQAWAVFAGMKLAGVEPTIVSYNSLISSCERCAQPDRAMEVFEGMKRRRAVAANAVTYNTLLSACAKAGRYDDAVRVYEDMRGAGLAEDVFTLTALLTACERAGAWQQAQRFFDGFCARGVRPNTVAYNRLIAALGAGGQWQAALAAFRDLERASKEGGAGGGAGGAAADAVTYGTLISVLERAGRWSEALEVYDGMPAAGVQPNGYIFASALNACEKGRQWARAAGLFKAVQAQRDMPVSSLTMLARRALYAFPDLLLGMPAPLVAAAQAAVDSGRAARRWVQRGAAGNPHLKP